MTTRQSLTIAAAIALAMALGPGVSAVPAQAPASPGASGGGSQEGIKVHGRWVIEVRSPDGTLVRRREFDNALQAGGQRTLAAVLRRQYAPGTWSVFVFDGLCPPHPGGGQACVLLESASGISAGDNTFTSLTLSHENLPVEVLILSGSFTAANAGNISAVATGVGRCSPENPNCAQIITSYNALLVPLFFSSTELSSPVPVQQGQIVQITVRFSFS